MARIHVLHENSTWLAPLAASLDRRGLPWRDWFVEEGELDITAQPPDGVFYNRMSASSHTRGHRFSPEYATAILAWLESHGRRVVNESRALALEVSKAAQYVALSKAGLPVPRTIVAAGRPAIVDAARRLGGPVIVKHNRGGKGIGVRLLEDEATVARHVASEDFEPPVDGLTLVQDYIRAPEPYITRMEFIGRELFYAVRVNTAAGFELCPAETCRTDAEPARMFEVIDGFDHPLIGPVRRFLTDNGIHVAGVEFIVDEAGHPFVYDVNTNTNYNPAAEAAAGRFAMDALAEYLGRQLAAESAAREAA